MLIYWLGWSKNLWLALPALFEFNQQVLNVRSWPNVTQNRHARVLVLYSRLNKNVY